MNEEERRKAFVDNEANLELAIDDAVEVIRALLRALAAKDASEQTGKAVAGLRSLLRVHGSDLPAKRVLQAAIAKLRNIAATNAEDGYIIETTPLAIKYFAEATTEESHFSGANRRRALDRYRTAIRDIDEIDQLRRLR